MHALIHKQERKGRACMQQFWQEEATKHHLKCLWDAGTGKFSPSWLTENVQCGVSSMKRLKTRTAQRTVQVLHARYLSMHLVIQSIVFSYNWKNLILHSVPL